MTARTKRFEGHRGDNWRLAIWIAVGSLLLLPAIAMQFTGEVRWDRSDFAAAAILLVGGGAAYEVVTRLTGDTRRRALFAAIIVAAVALVWLQGAVGIV